MVGDVECIAVADVTLDYAADALFANAPKESAEQMVREHGLQLEEIPLSFTRLVINSGRQRVLVDTGLGAGVVPSAGRLLENLQPEGITPEDIDTLTDYQRLPPGSFLDLLRSYDVLVTWTMQPLLTFAPPGRKRRRIERGDGGVGEERDDATPQTSGSAARA
jgi:hypothetical protein